MVSRTIHHDADFREALAAQSGGATAVTGTIIDTDGWEYITFLCLAGATTGTLTWQVFEDDAVGFSTPAAIAGATAVHGATDDNTLIAITVHLKNPSRQQFMRITVTNSAATTLEAAIAVLQRAGGGEIPLTVGQRANVTAQVEV